MIDRKIVASRRASQRRRLGEDDQPKEPERHEGPVQRLPEGPSHHFPGAMGPDVADLCGDKAGVFERLLGDVVPELFPAHLGQRLIAFHSGVALGSERGEDLLKADPGENGFALSCQRLARQPRTADKRRLAA